MTTLKDQLKLAATQADLHPEAAQLLQDFFLKLATSQQKDQLDAWLNEREANSHFFDLLLELNREGTGAATLQVLKQYKQKQQRKKNIFNKYLSYAFVGFLLIAFVDQLIPGHPISRFVKGKPIRDVSLRTLTISSGDHPTIILLSDSSRVELLPNSTLTYPEDFYLRERNVKLQGSARFDIRKAAGEPFRVEGPKVFMRSVDGAFLIQQENKGEQAVVSTNRGVVIFGYDEKNTWVVEAGEKGIYTNGKIELERPSN
jgi:ferric-dicitrate binding protein FerR (iron transport regulator)